jgi:Coenzyme PQQ synthesis protein D (PqqD)
MSVDPPLRVCPDVVTQDLGDGLVLLNLRTGIYWGLNRTGAVIWRGIENRAGIETICRQLREEFDGADDALDNTVHNLLSELVAERLILEEAPAGQEAPETADGAGLDFSKPKQSAAANNAGKLGARNKHAGNKNSRKTPGKR